MDKIKIKSPKGFLADEIKNIVEKKFSGLDVAQKFLERLEKGKLTIQENPLSHFCVYFAAVDPQAKEIFIGHHKKSGLWLVNGGHIDEGESLEETLRREIDEEWGLDFDELNVGEPKLLTIADIYNPEKQTCRVHFDIWHFVPVDKNNFSPDKEKLAEEFHENRWIDLAGAKKLTPGEAQHKKAFEFLENNLFVE